MITPKMRQRPPTAVGMATRRTVVPVSLTAGVVSVPFTPKVPFTVTVVVTLALGTSEMLTVILLVSGGMTAASAE